MLTPEKFFDHTMIGHEGAKLSLHRSDRGNWFDAARYKSGARQQVGVGQLIGSKYGVTPEVLARYLGVTNVTREMMEDVDAETASAIGVTNFFKKPKLDRLPWNRATMAVFDMAYNAGADRAVRLLQAAVGAPVDGDCGPTTKRYVERFLDAFGEEELAAVYCRKRKDFYRSIATGGNAKYLKGWIRRADSFLPGTKWWKEAGA